MYNTTTMARESSRPYTTFALHLSHDCLHMQAGSLPWRGPFPYRAMLKSLFPVSSHIPPLTSRRFRQMLEAKLSKRIGAEHPEGALRRLKNALVNGRTRDC